MISIQREEVARLKWGDELVATSERSEKSISLYVHTDIASVSDLLVHILPALADAALLPRTTVENLYYACMHTGRTWAEDDNICMYLVP